MKLQINGEEVNEIIAKYQEGYSTIKLAKIFKCCKATISKILKKNNICMRNTTETSRKYRHNQDFFETIDTEEKAYWLGFIYADGFIESKRDYGNQKLGITLTKKDHKHLEKFKKSIEATNPIYIYKGSGYAANNEFSKILLTSQKTVKDLINKGCVEHKTLCLKFPNIKQVPKKFQLIFIRGYMDGDGSINYYYSNSKPIFTLSFVGQKDFLDIVQTILKVNLKYSTKDNVTFQLNIGGNLQVKKILDKIYKNATIYLDRKHKKYLKLNEILRKQGC